MRFYLLTLPICNRKWQGNNSCCWCITTFMINTQILDSLLTIAKWLWETECHAHTCTCMYDYPALCVHSCNGGVGSSIIAYTQGTMAIYVHIQALVSILLYKHTHIHTPTLYTYMLCSTYWHYNMVLLPPVGPYRLSIFEINRRISPWQGCLCRICMNIHLLSQCITLGTKYIG